MQDQHIIYSIRLFIRLLPMFLLLAGCAREPVGNKAADSPQVYSFTADLESGSRASVSSTGACSWTANDEIAVYDELSGEFCIFSNGNGGGEFSFTAEEGRTYNFTHAYYPASVAKGEFAVSLPAEYTLAQAQAPSFFPMLGIVEGDAVHFRHLAAFLQYTIIGIPPSADSLVLSSRDVSLSGDYSLDQANPEILAAGGIGHVAIPINPGENENLVFHLPLPLGTYTLTCDVKSGAQTLLSYTTRSSKEVLRAKLITLSPASPAFSGGSGTEADPYQIASAEDLSLLSTVAADQRIGSAFFNQTADIDLVGAAFLPIGNDAVPFTGVYDGGGHSISNLSLDWSSADAGLFGCLQNATVKNLEIKAASIEAGADFAGAIAGELNGGCISGCKVDAKSVISAAGRCAGGIAGIVRSGIVRECATHCYVSAGADCAGGIAGYLYAKTEADTILVLNCVFEPVYKDGKMASATLQTGVAAAHMGGIAGSANVAEGIGAISVANCYAYPLEMRSTLQSGAVVNYIGGILGRIASGKVTVFNCLTPVTYSNVLIGGTRLNAKTYSTYNAAACIVGAITKDGSEVHRTFSKNTWPLCFNSSNTVSTSNIRIRMGDSNMRGFGGDGVLEALNAGVSAWNAENPDAQALFWAFDTTFGYPKPAGVDYPGVKTKKISLIGDSISTYEGYIFSTEESQMNKFYPDSGNNYADMVLNEQETWWWKIIYGKMADARLEVDNAFGGSTVTYTLTKIDGMPRDPSDRMQENSLQKRYLDYGVGDPDILFYHGGRNDFGQYGGNTDVLLGAYDETSLQNAYDADPGTLFNNYSAGTVAILRDFHLHYPDAKVLMIVHDMMSDGYDAAANAIAAFLAAKGFDIRCISLHEHGTNNKTNETLGITKEGGTHPNSVGCTNMANYIFEQLGSWLEEPVQKKGINTENYIIRDESSSWE